MTRRPRAWLWAGALSFPIVVLTHELGHFVAAWLAGYQNVWLHSMGVSAPGLEAAWAAYGGGGMAGEGLPWRAVIPVAAGVGVTYLTVLACWLLVRRGYTYPLIVWIGLAAPLRFYLSAGAVVAWIAGWPWPNMTDDEGRLAAVSGVPAGAWIACGAGVGLLASWAMLRRLGWKTARDALADGAFGLLLGILAYGGVIGPLLLP